MMTQVACAMAIMSQSWATAFAHAPSTKDSQTLDTLADDDGVDWSQLLLLLEIAGGICGNIGVALLATE